MKSAPRALAKIMSAGVVITAGPATSRAGFLNLGMATIKLRA
jgi:hypothetical protein